MDESLSLTCSFCQAKFRIKREYAHLRGRCPACGFRIAAPFPKPYEPPTEVSDSNEPLGLIPIEEEWPEPGRLETSEELPVYHYTGPVVSAAPEAQKKEPEPKREIYQLADNQSNAAPTRPTSDAPVVTPYKMADEVGEAPPPFPPSTPSPPASRPADPLPLVELAPAEELPKPQAQLQIPTAKSEKAPTAQASRPPANVIDALFQDAEAAPVAPAIHVDAAPDIPIAELAPAAEFVSPPASSAELGTEATKETKPIPIAQFAPDVKNASSKKRLAPKDGHAAKTTPVPEPDPTRGSPPADTFYTYKLNPAETNPVRTGGPKRPFAKGVFNFPWRPRNLPTLLWTALGLTILSFQGALIFALLQHAAQLAIIGVAFVGLSMIWVVIWTGSYAAACLFTNIQDTAAGNDEVDWPEGSWRDWFIPFLRLAWLAACCSMVCGILSLVLGLCLPTTAVFLVVAPPAFLIMLLSSMAGDSWFTLVQGRVLDQLGRHFLETVGVVIGSMILLAITTGFAILSIAYIWFLAPLTGFIAAASWLLFGRLIGRLGWVITQEPNRKRRKKKKKRRKDRSSADHGESADGPPPDAAEEPKPIAESDWA